MRLKTLCWISMVLTLVACKHQTPITGYWTGTMEMGGRSVDIETDFRLPQGSLSSRDLMLCEVPIEKVKVKGEGISFFSNFDTDATFEGAMEKGSITGLVHLQGVPPSLQIKFSLKQRPDLNPEKTYVIEKHVLQNRGVQLAAEIYKPKTDKLHPAIVLLHGSSLNLGRQYAYDADYFANLGFEVLIFDKRGNGGSTGNYATATFEDLVSDVVTCLKALKGRSSVDGSRIGLWGFSQGAMLLPLIASNTDIPRFLIAISPETMSTTEAAAFSDGKRLLGSGLPMADAQVAAETHRTVERMIRAGSSAAEVESFIQQNARKYGFMDQTGLSGSVRIGKGEFESYYWTGRTRDFSPYWAKLNIPTLAIYGEEDDFVDALSNERRIKALHNAKVTAKVFPEQATI